MSALSGEDVLYSLDGLESALALGLGGKDPAAVGSVLPNLLPPSKAAAASGQVTLLTYLRDLYPSDWKHFKERVARLAKAKASKSGSVASAEILEKLKDGFESISEWDFVAGSVLAPWAMELQLWASYRSQVWRTRCHLFTYEMCALKALGKLCSGVTKYGCCPCRSFPDLCGE